MFSKDTKVKFFHSEFLSVVEDEVNAFIKRLPEGYQISYIRYCQPKYEGAKYVVYIIYEPMMAILRSYDTMTKEEEEDFMKSLIQSDVKLFIKKE